MKKNLVIVAAAAALVAAVFMPVPAVGTTPLGVAKRALKTAKTAKKKAVRADRNAKRALSRFDGLNTTDGVLGGDIQEVRSSRSIGIGQVDSHSVACPPGTVVVSGGWTLISAEAVTFWDHQFINGWSVGVDNFFATSTNADVDVYAYCAVSTDQVATLSSATARAEERKLIAARRAADRRTDGN